MIISISLAAFHDAAFHAIDAFHDAAARRCHDYCHYADFFR